MPFPGGYPLPISLYGLLPGVHLIFPCSWEVREGVTPFTRPSYIHCIRQFLAMHYHKLIIEVRVDTTAANIIAANVMDITGCPLS